VELTALAPPDPLAVFREPTSKGKKEGKGNGRREEEERGGRKGKRKKGSKALCCEYMTTSTKLEIHNVSQRRQRRIEQWPRTTCTNIG